MAILMKIVGVAPAKSRTDVFDARLSRLEELRDRPVVKRRGV